MARTRKYEAGKSYNSKFYVLRCTGDSKGIITNLSDGLTVNVPEGEYDALVDLYRDHRHFFESKCRTIFRLVGEKAALSIGAFTIK